MRSLFLLSSIWFCMEIFGGLLLFQSQIMGFIGWCFGIHPCSIWICLFRVGKVVKLSWCKQVSARVFTKTLTDKLTHFLLKRLRRKCLFHLNTHRCYCSCSLKNVLCFFSVYKKFITSSNILLYGCCIDMESLLIHSCGLEYFSVTHTAGHLSVLFWVSHLHTVSVLHFSLLWVLLQLFAT